MLPAPALLAAGLLIGLLVLLPARRLQLGGVASHWIGLYALCVWLLAFALVFRPLFGRILVPFLIVLYVAPFVAGPERIRAIVRRGPGSRTAGRSDPARPPIKNVTPPDDPTRPE